MASTVGLDPFKGAWGPTMDVIMCLLPIAFLVTTTVVKRVHLSTSISLPLAAFFMWLVRLAYLSLEADFTNAAVVYGALDALTPLSIIAGAICLFETMEATRCLPWMIARISELSGNHPVAEVFLIGWAFSYLIEGASGFGTPVALAAPMLVSLGHDPISTIAACLAMNTLATPYGAVGTPIWFGLGGLGLSEDNLKTVGFKVSIILAVNAHIIPILAARFLISWGDLRRNWLFILLSIWSALIPAVALSKVSTDFSSLVGGIVSTIAVGILAKFRVGMKPCVDSCKASALPVHSKDTELGTVDGAQQKSSERVESSVLADTKRSQDSDRSPPDTKLDPEQMGLDDPSKYPAFPVNPVLAEHGPGTDEHDAALASVSWKSMFLRTLPLTLTVLLLVLTRVEQFKIKENIRSTTPFFRIHFGHFFTFRMSAWFSFNISEIFDMPPGILSWSYDFLYVPFFLPFIVASFVTVIIFRRELPPGQRIYSPFIAGFRRVSAIVPALVGSLILVALIRQGESPTARPAYIIGYNLSDFLSDGFVAISAPLGSLGSFFSGSTTVSGLTFGPIQKVAAMQIDVPVTSMLALQVLGGTAGNMICINNIIAAKTVVGLRHEPEGTFIKKTFPLMLIEVVVGTLVGLIFLYA